MRGAAGPGTDPWCDTTPPPPLPAQGTWPRADWARPPAARAPTHTGTAVSPSRQRLDEVPGSSAVWTAVRPDNQKGLPSRASEVRAHLPWVTTFGASRDPTQPNPNPRTPPDRVPLLGGRGSNLLCVPTSWALHFYHIRQFWPFSGGNIFAFFCTLGHFPGPAVLLAALTIFGRLHYYYFRQFWPFSRRPVHTSTR